MHEPQAQLQQRLAQVAAAARACTLCQAQLPYPPRPVFRAAASARLLIVGQAPGTRVHASGIPWDDLSGKRLRKWLGLTPEQFYAPEKVAIIPMGFCYPGRGVRGDLPPRPECAPRWHSLLLENMPKIRLTLAIGRYAVAHYMPDHCGSLGMAVQKYQASQQVIALPHPSPRNNRWLRDHPWFEGEIVPKLQRQVHQLLCDDAF